MSWHHVLQRDPLPYSQATWAQGLTQEQRLRWPVFVSERYPNLSLEEAAYVHAALPEPKRDYGSPLIEHYWWRLAGLVVEALKAASESRVPVVDTGEHSIDVYHDDALSVSHRRQTAADAIRCAQTYISTIPATLPTGISRFSAGDLTIRIDIAAGA